MVQQEILRELRDAGVRLTPQRQEVLKTLFERTAGKCQPLSAEEILEQVRKRYPGMSQDTVYRTLATFKKLGIVREVDFRDNCRRFELTGEKGVHHHHLVCLACGRSWELPLCPADCLNRVEECCPDFEVKDHAFIVYGYCSKCRRERKDEHREAVRV